ncbi:MAG TPA: phosphatidate cytidylyltransferase [Candidatus Coprenecus stercoravium]|uniref:Phosphatidate cytidylyltransferase n=1 Tax=Candidatus Coprenecus stercoravium TaxID=2840735 RepID=A0A9D2GQQ0_9BACT|nr:phosphatidate cytidylyltransferase [Candidatus Coprenecus stercoravium]
MRNLLTRTLSGIVFLALFLTALLWHPAAYGVLFMIAVFIMMTEYLNITVGPKEETARILTVITALLTFMLFFFHAGFGLEGKWLLVLPVMTALIFTSILFTREGDAYRSTPFILTSLLYIALPFSLTNLIVFGPEGDFDGRILLAVMIIIWSSDVGAYLFGMAFGQKHGHKLFPSISPKKSWEGYFGGLAMSLAAGWCTGYFHLIDFPWYHCLILALLVNISSTIGDLAESQLKRNFGVKDAGRIMPGHGGLLDRFDGALLAFPVSVLYITAFGL